MHATHSPPVHRKNKVNTFRFCVTRLHFLSCGFVKSFIVETLWDVGARFALAVAKPAASDHTQSYFVVLDYLPLQACI